MPLRIKKKKLIFGITSVITGIALIVVGWIFLGKPDEPESSNDTVVKEDSLDRRIDDTVMERALAYAEIVDLNEEEKTVELNVENDLLTIHRDSLYLVEREYFGGVESYIERDYDFRDLQVGSQVVLVGKYDGNNEGTFTVEESGKFQIYVIRGLEDITEAPLDNFGY